GFLEHTDHHVGRLVDALSDLGVQDDTLIYVIVGDNGASAEGTPNGTFNEIITLNGAAQFETAEFMAAHIEQFGTPEAYNHYAVGWAHAMDTPYQWTKQVASHWGGTRNGAVVHWPNGIAARGETRSQFHHVIDVAPTVLEAAGIPHPMFVHGIQQQAIEGVGMGYCFDEPGAAERPEKLRQLQRLFLIEATKHNVLPLDDRRVERLNSDLAGRPVLVKGNSQLLFGGMGRLTEHAVLNLKNKSHSVTADVVVPA